MAIPENPIESHNQEQDPQFYVDPLTGFRKRKSSAWSPPGGFTKEHQSRPEIVAAAFKAGLPIPDDPDYPVKPPSRVMSLAEQRKEQDIAKLVKYLGPEWASYKMPMPREGNEYAIRNLKSGSTAPVRLTKVAEGRFDDIFAVGEQTRGGQHLISRESIVINPGGTDRPATSLQNYAADIKHAEESRLLNENLLSAMKRTSAEKTETTNRAVYDLYNTGDVATQLHRQQVSVVVKGGKTPSYEVDRLVKERIIPRIERAPGEKFGDKDHTYGQLEGMVWDARLGTFRPTVQGEGSVNRGPQGELLFTLGRAAGKEVAKPTINTGTMLANPVIIGPNNEVYPVTAQPVQKKPQAWAKGNIRGRTGVRQIQAFENIVPGAVLDLNVIKHKSNEYYTIPGRLSAQLPDEDITQQAAKLSIKGKVIGKELHAGKVNTSPIRYKGTSLEWTNEQHEDEQTREVPGSTSSKAGIITGVYAVLPSHRNIEGKGVTPEFDAAGNLMPGFYSNADQIPAFREALGKDADISLSPFVDRSIIGVDEVKKESTKTRGPIKQGTILAANASVEASFDNQKINIPITHVGAEVKSGQVAELMIAAQPAKGIRFLANEWANARGTDASRKFSDWVNEKYNDDKSQEALDITGDEWRQKYEEFGGDVSQMNGLQFMQDILKPIVNVDLDTPEGKALNKKYLSNVTMGYADLELTEQVSKSAQEYNFKQHVAAIMDANPAMSAAEAGQVALSRSSPIEKDGKSYQVTRTKNTFIAPIIAEKVAEFPGEGSFNLQAMRALHSAMPKLANMLGLNPYAAQGDTALKSAWQEAVAVNMANASRRAKEKYVPSNATEMTKRQAYDILAINANSTDSFISQVKEIAGGGMLMGGGALSMGADAIRALEHAPFGEEVGGLGRGWREALLQQAGLVTSEGKGGIQKGDSISRFGSRLKKLASKKGAISRSLGSRSVEGGGYHRFTTARGLEVNQGRVPDDVRDTILRKKRFKEGAEFKQAQKDWDAYTEKGKLPVVGFRSPQESGEDSIIAFTNTTEEQAGIAKNDVENRSNVYISETTAESHGLDFDLDSWTGTAAIENVDGKLKVLEGAELEEFTKNFTLDRLEQVSERTIPKFTGLKEVTNATYQMFKDVVEKVNPIKKVFENTKRYGFRETQRELSGFNQSKAGMGIAFNEELRSRQAFQRMRGVSEKEIQTMGLAGSDPAYSAMLNDFFRGDQRGGSLKNKLMARAYIDSKEKTKWHKTNTKRGFLRAGVFNDEPGKMAKSTGFEFDPSTLGDTEADAGGRYGIGTMIDRLIMASTQPGRGKKKEPYYTTTNRELAEMFSVGGVESIHALEKELEAVGVEDREYTLKKSLVGKTAMELATTGAFVRTFANAVRNHLDPDDKAYEEVQGALNKLPESVRKEVLVQATQMNMETGNNATITSSQMSQVLSTVTPEAASEYEQRYGPAIPTNAQVVATEQVKKDTIVATTPTTATTDTGLSRRSTPVVADASGSGIKPPKPPTTTPATSDIPDPKNKKPASHTIPYSDEEFDSATTSASNAIKMAETQINALAMESGGAQFDVNGSKIPGPLSPAKQQMHINDVSNFLANQGSDIVGTHQKLKDIVKNALGDQYRESMPLSMAFGLAMRKAPEKIISGMQAAGPDYAKRVQAIGKMQRSEIISRSLGMTGKRAESDYQQASILSDPLSDPGFAFNDLGFAGKDGVITSSMNVGKGGREMPYPKTELDAYNKALDDQKKILKDAAEGVTTLSKREQKLKEVRAEDDVVLSRTRLLKADARQTMDAIDERMKSGTKLPGDQDAMIKAEKAFARYSQKEESLMEPKETGIGGFLRRTLGGWGLMYAGKMAGFVTQGTEYGQQEATGLGVASGLAGGKLFGGGQAPYNQMQQLANMKAISGANYSAMTGLEQLQAENPTVRDAVSAGKAALGGYSMMQFLSMNSSGAAKLNFAKAAPWVALATTFANVGLTAFSKEQDPGSLAYRIANEQAGPTDYLANFMLNGDSSFNSHLPTWMGGGTDLQRSQYEQGIEENKKLNASLGSGQKAGDYFGNMNKEDALVQHASLVKKVLDNNPNLSSDTVLKAISFSVEANLPLDIGSINKIATDITLGRASTDLAMSSLALMGITPTAALANEPGKTSMAGLLATAYNQIGYGSEQVSAIQRGQELAASNLGPMAQYLPGSEAAKALEDWGNNKGYMVTGKHETRGFTLKYGMSGMGEQYSRPEFVKSEKPQWLLDLIKKSDEQYTALSSLNTNAKAAYLSNVAAFESDLSLGLTTPENMPLPTMAQKNVSAEDLATLQRANQGKMTANQYRTSAIETFAGKAWKQGLGTYDDKTGKYTGLAAKIDAFFKGIPQESIDYYSKLFSLDPSTLAQFSTTAAGQKGGGLSQFEMPLITGGTLNARYLAGDMGVSGKQATGLPWGTMGITRPGMTAQQSAADIWGANWQTNPNLSQRTINASIGYDVSSITGNKGEMWGGSYGRAAENIQYQYENTMAQIGISQKSQAMQMAFTTGVGIGNYSGTINPQTGSPFGFSTGNFGFNIPGVGSYQSQGGGLWGIQDAQRNLGYAQQEWQFGFQQRSLDLSQKQFGENMSLNVKGAQMQRGWAKEDWAFNANVRELQWGWKQEDFQENVRFMTGRERKLAERQMGRDTIMHDLEGEQIEKQKNRQKELWRLEDQRFALQRTQFAENLKMQQEQLNMSKKFFAEQKKLTEEQVKMERAMWVQQQEATKEQMALQAALALEQRNAANAMLAYQMEQDKIQGELNLLSAKFWEGIYNWLVKIGEIVPTDNVDAGEGSGCFIAGTPVTMENGITIPIEKVKVGDRVLSYDTKKKKTVSARITRVLHHDESVVNNGYFIVNGEIGVTPEHAVFVNGKWILASKLKVGDNFINRNGEKVPVVTLVKIEDRVPVYNLHTSHNTHNYFANDVLVHNIASKNARGGSWLVARPTTMTFGEQGPERVDITPLGRDSYMSFGNSGGGQTQIINVYVGNQKLESYILTAVEKELKN